MIKKISDTKYKLCCSGNCSLVEYVDGFIVISDDFGGSVKIPLDEAELISEAARKTYLPQEDD